MLAPWPPSFLPLQALLHLFLGSAPQPQPRTTTAVDHRPSRWCLSAQAVDKVGRYLYLTSVLELREEPEGQEEGQEEGRGRGRELSLRANPLFAVAQRGQGGAEGEGDPREQQQQRRLWREYLRFQLATLKKRQRGLLTLTLPPQAREQTQVCICAHVLCFMYLANAKHRT